MSSAALITRDAEWTAATFNQEAQRIKSEALQKAALVGHVNSAAEQTPAVEAQQAIAQTLSLAEKARVACKAPALEFGRKVDDAHRAFVADLKEEQVRLAGLVGSFQQLEQAKAAAAERARRLEEERIEREKQAEIMRVAREQAEAQRVLDEAAAKAAKAEREATNEKERIEAERRRIELESAQARATADSHAALDAISNKYAEQAKDLPPVTFTAARAEGQRVTSDWEIQVSDIHLLYRHHPNCVELTPRMSEIKNLLKGGTTPKGVNAKAIVKAGVTSGRPRAAIDV